MRESSNDERLNALEDTVNKLKEAINHNTKVARSKHESDRKLIEELKGRVNLLEKSNSAAAVDFGDIFKGMGKKS